MPYEQKATAKSTTGKNYQKKQPVSSAVRQGVDPRSSGFDGASERGPDFLKIDANTYVDCTILVEANEIFSIEQCAIWLRQGSGSISPAWVYIGEDDPSHELGDSVQRRYKAYLPVLVGDEPKVFSMSRKLHTDLMEIADMNNDQIKGLNIRIKRTGASLQTRYSIHSKGTRTDVDDVEEVDVLAALGPLDREGIEKLLCRRLNASSFDEILTRYEGKKITVPLEKLVDEEEEEEPAPKKAKAKARKPKPVVEEDEDEEDLEL
jgi:hypothetical protein